MMHTDKHIICQKRTANCSFPQPRAPKPPNAKKSELFVNFGEAQKTRFPQF
jgi:hypothetical protein